MNILDTRDLAKRLEELRDERTDLVDAIGSAQEEYDNQENIIPETNDELEETNLVLEELKDDLISAKLALTDWDIDNKEELDELENLESEISEWNYGATLIDESDFTEYCQDLAEDIGAVGVNVHWIVIDWDATADNLKADYTTVTYQGTDCLVRA